MKRSFSFDRAYEPPAALLPVRIAHPTTESAALLLPLLVDTGADCTALPPSVVRSLDLPRVGSAEVEGVGGGGGHATVHAARVSVGGTARLVRVVAFGSEALLGRDVLRHLAFTYDGPGGRIVLATPVGRADHSILAGGDDTTLRVQVRSRS
jgi:predicted aspartyl protease